MIKYRIKSKSDPSLTIIVVNCDDFEASKRRQLFMLAHKIHPTPEMYNHLIRYGICDFDFVPEIEQAIIKPEVETRKKFKSSKAGSSMD